MCKLFKVLILAFALVLMCATYSYAVPAAAVVAVFFAAGTATTALAVVVVTAVINMALMMALSLLISKIFAPEEPNIDELMGGMGSDLGIGANYKGAFPVVTITQGTPVQECFGKVRCGGNIIRGNDPEDEDSSNMIIVHSSNQSEVTKYTISHVTHFAYYLNDALIDDLTSYNTTNHNTHYWSWSGSTAHTTPVNHLFSDKLSAFRGLSLSEIRGHKDEQFRGLSNVNVIGNFAMPLEIGQDAGGARSFSRNPAQVMWSWYIDKEGYAASGLSQAAFQALFDYCAAYPENGIEIRLTPPGPGPNVVRESSYSGSSGWPVGAGGGSEYRGWSAFRRDSVTTGNWGGNQGWLSAGADVTGYLTVDMGSAYKYTKFIFENNHTNGHHFDQGVRDFKVMGSNNRDLFLGSSYSSGATLVTNSIMTQKTTADPEPETFAVVGAGSTIPYRYLYFSAVSNYQGSGTTEGVYNGGDTSYWTLAGTGWVPSSAQARSGTTSLLAVDSHLQECTLTRGAGPINLHAVQDGSLSLWMWRDSAFSFITPMVDSRNDILIEAWNGGNQTGATWLKNHVTDYTLNDWVNVKIPFRALGANKPSALVDTIKLKVYRMITNGQISAGNFYIDDFDLTEDENTNHVGLRQVQIYGNCPRYQFDYVFDSTSTLNDAKKMLWKSFHGSVIRNQGLLTPIYEKAGAIVHAFTLDNIVKDSLSWGKPIRPNIFRIHFINAHDSFRKDVVELKNEDEIAAKGPIINEEQCYFITEPEIAMRRCQQKYNKFSYTDFFCKLTGLPDSQHVTIYDIVTVSHPKPGWSGKQFMVKEVSEDAYGRPAFTMEAYFEGIYNSGTGGYPQSYSSYLPNPYTPISGVTNLSGTTGDFFEQSGNYVSTINVQYKSPSSPFFKNTLINFAVDGGDYQYYGQDNSRGSGFLMTSTQGKWVPNSSVTINAVATSVGGVEGGASAYYNLRMGLPDIQTHVDLLPSQGGTLSLPEGSFYLQSSVTMPSKNVYIRGSGIESTTIINPNGKNAFNIHNKSKNFQFSEFTYKSSNTTMATNMVHCWGDSISDNASRVQIWNCHADLWSDPLYTYSTGDRMLYVSRSSGSCNLNRCSGTCGTPFYVFKTRDVRCQDNTWDGSQGNSIAIWSGCQSVNINNNTLTNVTFTGVYTTGVSLQCMIDNNSIEIDSGVSISAGANWYGINSQEQGAMITNNTVLIPFGSGVSSNYIIDGIQCQSDGTQITGNVITMEVAMGDAGTHKLTGIRHEGSNGLLQHNTITLSDTRAASQNDGIFLAFNADGNTITNNTIDMTNSRVGEFGVRIYLGNNNKVTNNKMQNVAWSHATYIQSILGNIGNEIGDNQQSGTAVSNTDGQFAKKFLNQ